MFSCIIKLSHMPSFIAGAINTGQFDAKTTVVKIITNPLAILEIVFSRGN